MNTSLSLLPLWQLGGKEEGPEGEILFETRGS